MEEIVRYKLLEYSQRYGVPTWILSAIVEVESNFNQYAQGDKQGGVYYSFGLLQLYTRGGQGDGYTKEQLFDIDTNLSIGVPPIANAYKKGVQKGLTGWELLKYTASHSGHPSYTGVWTTGYVALLEKSYKNGNELGGGTAQAKITVSQSDVSKWVKGNTKGLHTVLLARLVRMAKAHNKAIELESGFRSTQQQQKLYDLYLQGGGNVAAKPGTSAHNFGIAVDVKGWAINISEAEYVKYGLCKPVKTPQYEPWHIEPYEVMSEERGKAGFTNVVKKLDALQNGTTYSDSPSGLQKGIEIITSKVLAKTRNGTSEIGETNNMEQGAYQVFKNIEEMMSWDSPNWDDGFKPMRFIIENGKALGTRLIVVVLGVLLLVLGILLITKG